MLGEVVMVMMVMIDAIASACITNYLFFFFLGPDDSQLLERCQKDEIEVDGVCGR